MGFPASIGVSLLPITVKMRQQGADFNIEARATAMALSQLEAFREVVRKYPPEPSDVGRRGRSFSQMRRSSNVSMRAGKSAGGGISRDFYARTETLYNAWKIEQQLTSANVTLRLYNDAVESGANRRDRGRPYAFFVHGTTQRYGARLHRDHGWKQIKDEWPPFRQTFTRGMRPLIQDMITQLVGA